MVRKVIFFLLLSVVIRAADSYASESESSVLFYFEGGVYNKAYIDLSYVDKHYSSFPVMMKSVSLEYKTRDEEGFISGYGFAAADIAAGKKYNYSKFEYQPRSFVAVPYAFIGYDFVYVGIELGAGSLFYYRDFEPVERFNPDGSVYQYQDSGFYLDRKRSRGFPNFCFRFLPKRIIHLKVRLGREEFHPIDSLFNMAIVLPWKKNIFEINASLSTHFKQFPVSNQKIGFMYSKVFGQFTCGASVRYLFYNEHGGSREDIDPLDPENLSAGLLFSMKWK